MSRVPFTSPHWEPAYDDDQSHLIDEPDSQPAQDDEDPTDNLE